MNNAKLAIEYSGLEEAPAVDVTSRLHSRESELVQVIDCIRKIEATEEWSSLKKLVLDGVVETLEKNLQREASKENPDLLALARINGQLIWARRYSNLSKLGEYFRLELTGIRKQLHGKTEKDG